MAVITLEQGLIAGWLLDTTVKASIANRVFPMEANQGQVFGRMILGRNPGGRRLKAMNLGRLPNGCAFIQHDYQWRGAAQYSVIKVLANYCMTVLDGFQGMFGGVQILGAFLQDDPDGVIPPIHGDEQGVETISQVYKIQYFEQQ